MRLNASKKLFPLSAALAIFSALSLAPQSALAGNEGGGLYSNGGSSEGGGIYSTGADNEGGGVYNTGANNQGGGIFNNGSASQGGGVYNNGSASEGGGAFNSGASSESGLGFYSYVPPNPHAWSTYSGPKAPPAWGATPLSGSGGIASAGSEAEAKSTSAIPTDSIDYSNYKADTASHVHYYGR